jgi:hypothetical protein
VPKINYAGSGHGRLTIEPYHFWEYDTEFCFAMLMAAFGLIISRSLFHKSCNDCFKRLPGGRSFDDVWKDDSVWLSYDSRSDRGWYGGTVIGGKDITISRKAFDKGAEWVAGTLVHELAHINGAPTTTAEADETLLQCDFKSAYEGVIGQRQRIGLPTRMA